jgi:hypothetical protein
MSGSLGSIRMQLPEKYKENFEERRPFVGKL